MRLAILALMILAGFAGSRVEARSPTACNGRVVIQAVYQTAAGGGRYEYRFAIRNATNQRVTADVGFSEFPPGVTLYSPVLSNIPVDPRVASEIRFGRGTNSQVSNATVRIVYDGAASSGATVRVTNCRIE